MFAPQTMRASFLGLVGLLPLAYAQCPYMAARDTPGSGAAGDTEEFLSQYYLDDSDSFMTSDAGGPIADQDSLQVGDRGPTLLEDFIFRQKIQRFDHERVCGLPLDSLL